MAELEGQNPGGAGLVFAAHNNHSPQCSLPPRVRKEPSRNKLDVLTSDLPKKSRTTVRYTSKLFLDGS